MTMTSEDCSEVMIPDGVDLDDIVLLGSVLPITPPYDSIGEPFRNSIELAVREFNFAISENFPNNRQVLWINCESSGTSEKGVRAAEHLRDLGVPAIVGPVFSKVFIDMLEQVTRDAKIFNISPSATALSISDIDDDGYGWRVLPPDFYQVNSIIDRVAGDPLAGQKTLGMSKVVIIHKDDIYGTDLAEAVQTVLEDRLGAANVKVTSYKDPAALNFDTALITQELTNAVTFGLTQMPDAEGVIIMGTSETVGLLQIYMLGFQNAGISPPAGFKFLFSHSGVPSMSSIPVALGETIVPLIEAVSPRALDEENYFAFGLRYQAQFNDAQPITAAPLAYDAAMVALLSTATIPTVNEVTGEALKSAVPKISDKAAGIPVSFGDSDFVTSAITILSQGGTIDIQGISGDVDFNPLGETRTDMVGWDLAELNTDPKTWTVSPNRIYSLNAIPAEDGTWVELCTNDTTCGSAIDICIMPDLMTPPPICLPVPCSAGNPCPGFRTCNGTSNLCEKAPSCSGDPNCAGVTNGICEANLCVVVPCANNGECPMNRTCDIGNSDHCQ